MKANLHKSAVCSDFAWLFAEPTSRNNNFDSSMLNVPCRIS